MSVRESVLRLHRWRLQERQDYLAGLESLLERLRGDARRLQDETAEGGRVFGRADDEGGDSPPLVRPLNERQRKIERSMIEVETQIGEARATVGDAMQEVKHAEFGLAPQAAPNRVRAVRRSRRERTGGLSNMPLPERTRLF